MIFCLFKVIFFGFYHGKSPLNHQLGHIFLLFSKHQTIKAKMKVVQIAKAISDPCVFFFSQLSGDEEQDFSLSLQVEAGQPGPP